MELRLTCVITLASVLLTLFVISNAFYHKKQFYPSVVYLTKSGASLAALYAQTFVLVYLLAQMARKIFFGQLRQAESEHLAERAWYAITETCLAFTVFRDDFSPKFVAQFMLLLVLKCFHWLAEDRVDYMERSPVITVLFHVRLMSIVGILSSFDSYFVSLAYFTTLLRGASVQIVFGFEYAILMTIIFHIAIKYILHAIDSRNVHPWENKAVYLLHAELVINFMRVVLYITFISVMIRLHTFPLFSVRPMYLTLKAFKKALSDVFLSRRAINYLNHLYPDATEAELSESDNVCIICREEMRSGQAKKLPCNHIFHAACLRSWFQRQQTCPTCRLDIIRATTSQPDLQNQRQEPQAPGGPLQPNALNPNQLPPGFGQPPFFNQFNFAPQPLWAPQPPPSSSAPSSSGHPTVNQGPPPASFPNAAPSAAFAPGGFAMPTTYANFAPPPMLYPGPFMLPFPAPPTFSGLTDDEVRRMEVDSRLGVEARVLALRNIQTLLDAAVVQLQQYLSIMPVLPNPPHVRSQSNAVPVPATGVTSESRSEGQGERVDFDLGVAVHDQQATEQDMPSTSKTVLQVEQNQWSALVAGGSEKQDVSVSERQKSEPYDEVREKRLKHFAKTLNCDQNTQ